MATRDAFPVSEGTNVKANAIIHKMQGTIDVMFSFASFLKTKGVAPPVEEGSLVLKSAIELAEMIRNKDTSCCNVVRTFINRIREVNAVLNCVVKEDDRGFDDAFALATQYDSFLATATPEDIESLREKKPFFGVPLTCKEAFECCGRPNTSGMKAHKDKIAAKDAPVVAAMKAAGCILIGVTTVPEMCMWWETMSYNHGTTNNPYDTRRIVGGSSGGEACTISAGASVIGIGSDIGGSIRMPAFFNGVYGHKPSPHLVPNEGQFPGHENDDDLLTTGPICSHVEDLIPMFKIMVGEKAEDLRLDEEVDFNKFTLKVYSVESIANALGVSPVCNALKSVQKKVEESLKNNQGAEIKPTTFPEFDETFFIWSCTLALTGSPSNCERMSTGLNGDINPLKELVKILCPIPFIRGSKHTVPAVVLCLLEKLNRMSLEEKKKYAAKGEALRQKIVEILGKDGVLLLPSSPRNAYYHHRPKASPIDCIYTMIGNVLQLPITQVPLGLDTNKLPLGIQVMAGPLNDRLSIAVAGALSKAFGGWTPPMKVEKKVVKAEA